VVGKLGHSFDVRSIFPRSAYVPEDRAVISTSAPGVQKREMPQVGLRVVVTDKAASIGLPLRSNRLNYRAFVGSEARFHKWCRDIFLYYWEKSKPYLPS
jgi:hypothetical protein